MCKEGWSVWLGQEGVAWGGMPKIPQKGVEQKRGEGKNIFERGGKLGQEVGALKRGGAGTPLETMTL